MKAQRFTIAIAMLASLIAGHVPAGLAAAEHDPYEATITKVVRQVEWQRHRTSRWQKARLETLLLVGDTVRTGDTASAELRYGDGSVTRVGSLTSLTLTGDRKREIRLEGGKIWLNIKKSGAGMKIITPGAVAAVTGTELMVEFDPVRKTTEVTVFEGAVNVTGDVGNLVRVMAGTTTRVPFRAPAVAPMPLDNRKLQERDNLFKPLSVEEAPAAEPKQPSTSEPESKQPDGQSTEPKQPESQPEANQPEVTTETPGEVETTVPQPEVTDPQAEAPPAQPQPAVEAEKKPVSPDLNRQVQINNDPRLINGSPTTGTVRVIIE